MKLYYLLAGMKGYFKETSIDDTWKEYVWTMSIKNKVLDGFF